MIARIFLNHPRSVDENYAQHAVFAGGFALRLLGAGMAALIHAFVPCLFEKTAGKMIGQMHERLHGRGHNEER